MQIGKQHGRNYFRFCGTTAMLIVKGRCIMRTAVIYTRSASPNEQATNAQLEICREYARVHGYNVVAEFSDNGYSGMNFNRPAFIAMNDSRDKWETLIIYRLDKLSRNRFDFSKYRKTLLDAGKEIISTVEPLPDEIFSMLENLQAHYSIQKKGVQRR